MNEEEKLDDLKQIFGDLMFNKSKQDLALDVMELTTENLDLQQRLNKAIEYIEDIMDLTKECPQELLSILKGENNE